MSELLKQKYEILREKLRKEKLKAAEIRNVKHMEMEKMRQTIRKMQYAKRKQMKSNANDVAQRGKTNTPKSTNSKTDQRTERRIKRRVTNAVVETKLKNRTASKAMNVM